MASEPAEPTTRPQDDDRVGTVRRLGNSSRSATTRQETIREVHLGMPRLGKGLCWSLLVAEMAAERTVPAPNPWTPTDPEGEAA